jgi:hypothetical protein
MRSALMPVREGLLPREKVFGESSDFFGESSDFEEETTVFGSVGSTVLPRAPPSSLIFDIMPQEGSGPTLVDYLQEGK